jgi:Na+/H+ antiporter NhaD/arsenite permease-like protein
MANVLTDSINLTTALIIGGLIGKLFGSMQNTALTHNKRMQKKTWVLISSSVTRIIILLLMLVLVQILFPFLFFIFIISNMGGILSPVGDPPLFIGYLKGIPFFWPISNLWHIWLLGLTLSIIVFYIFDSKAVQELTSNVPEMEPSVQKRVEVSGLHNLVFLIIVLAAVFISRPLFLREFVMAISAACSYFTTKKEIHDKNDFSIVPIKEVSILFLGIFVTMAPALEWISHNAMNFGLQSPGQFYWYTGALSSILDNTPTYLNFLSAASRSLINLKSATYMFPFIQCHNLPIYHGETYLLSTSYITPELYRIHHAITNPHSAVQSAIHLSNLSITHLLNEKNMVIQAISAGAVFFGAMTYIGNGPNFMVKKIAEESGVQCPSFINYILHYSVPILLPVYFLIWLIFFK